MVLLLIEVVLAIAVLVGGKKRDLAAMFTVFLGT